MLPLFTVRPCLHSRHSRPYTNREASDTGIQNSAVSGVPARHEPPLLTPGKCWPPAPHGYPLLNVRNTPLPPTGSTPLATQLQVLYLKLKQSTARKSHLECGGPQPAPIVYSKEGAPPPNPWHSQGCD